MLTDAFLCDLKQRYFDVLSELTGSSGFEKTSWDFINGSGDVEVNAIRGTVFEKVCVSDISARVTIPDRDYESVIQWLGIQTFPSNPLVPMLMGVFEHVAEKDTEHHPAYFDVYPVVPFAEDREFLLEAIGDVCEKHARPYPDLPESYLKMFRLKEAGIGVGYGAGLSLMPEEENAAYFEDAARAILDAYAELVRRRRDAPCSREHIVEMNRFRAEWVKFIFMDNRFFQGGISLGVPPESFMLHMLPPSVVF